VKHDQSRGPVHITRRDLFATAAGLIVAGAAHGETPSSRIVDMDATALSAAIHRRDLSCVEVMQAYLEQIARLNSRVTALVALQEPEILIARARACDEQLARNLSSGWMHGMPHAVKDLEPVRGIVSTSGSPIFRTFVPTEDSYPVERLRKAGAIFVGKTNVPEFGLGSQSYNRVYGTTANAYDLTKTAGGSSGGAAAALALHMVPVADGSDYGGSLRNPAAFNNVFGFRPSIGRVAHGGDSFLPSMGVIGPVARTVPDLAMLLSVMAGYDPRDPSSLGEDPAQFTRSLSRDFRGVRIAWLGDYGGYLPFEPGILALCRSALGVFERLGCDVDKVTPDYPMEEVWRDFVTLRAWQTSAGLAPLYRDPTKRMALKPEAIWEVEHGLALRGADVARASEGRNRWYQAFLALLADYDFVLTPSAQVFPFNADIHWPREVAGRAMDSYHRWMEVVAPITMTGCPALNVPVGFNTAGLPMGMQIVGRPRADFACLQLAQAYDLETGWVRRRPPPLSGMKAEIGGGHALP